GHGAAQGCRHSDEHSLPADPHLRRLPGAAPGLAAYRGPGRTAAHLAVLPFAGRGGRGPGGEGASWRPRSATGRRPHGGVLRNGEGEGGGDGVRPPPPAGILIGRRPQTGRWPPFCKRLFDVTVALAALVLTAPLFLLIALLIKVDSPGPVFFRQVRVGRHRRHF